MFNRWGPKTWITATCTPVCVYITSSNRLFLSPKRLHENNYLNVLCLNTRQTNKHTNSGKFITFLAEVRNKTKETEETQRKQRRGTVYRWTISIENTCLFNTTEVNSTTVRTCVASFQPERHDDGSHDKRQGVMSLHHTLRHDPLSVTPQQALHQKHSQFRTSSLNAPWDTTRYSQGRPYLAT